MKHVRHSLPRERKFASSQLVGSRQDGVFAGYASLFGKKDLGNDIVMPGAFAASLARRGAEGVRMLFQHDPSQPIGVWTSIAEDHMGLRVEGRLTPGVAKAAEVGRLIAAGAVDGLSIGFRTRRSRLDRKSGARRIFEADLWEISIVTFPMQPEARVEPPPAPGRRERKRLEAGFLALRMRGAAQEFLDQF